MYRMLSATVLSLVFSAGVSWAQDAQPRRFVADPKQAQPFQVQREPGPVQPFQVQKEQPSHVQKAYTLQSRQVQPPSQTSNQEIVNLLKQIIQKLEAQDKQQTAKPVALGFGAQVRAKEQTPKLVARPVAPPARGKEVYKIAPPTTRAATLQPSAADLEQRLDRLMQEVEQLRRDLKKIQK